MFTIDDVNSVMSELQKKKLLFASEAHFQMSFIFEAFKLFKGQFEYIPEYPIDEGEADLLIIDKKNQWTYDDRV